MKTVFLEVRRVNIPPQACCLLVGATKCGDTAELDHVHRDWVGRNPWNAADDAYLLLAGLAVACRYGFETADALTIAENTYVNVNIHKDENRSILNSLSVLPDSCAASADCLEAQRAIYEKDGVFAPSMIDGIISSLRSFDDRTLRADIGNDQGKILALVETYFHCG